MSERIMVVGLGGSLAPASKSLAALKIALDAAAEAGAGVELFDIRARAGVEGSLSQGVRIAGLRQARYIGLAKTHLQHNVKRNRIPPRLFPRS